jgi:outer membrane protein
MMGIQGKRHEVKSIPAYVFRQKDVGILFPFYFLLFILAGCISDELPQHSIKNKDYMVLNQIRSVHGTTAAAADYLPDRVEKTAIFETKTDPNTGKKNVTLTIEQVLAGTLANSLEITVVGFEPALARGDITKAAAQFDVTAFGQANYEQQDNPVSSIYQPGQSDDRSVETGIKQKSITGTQWSVSYAVTRNWDDLSGRTLSTRYEPILAFELKQPLWRDGWEQVNRAGLDTAKISYDIAMAGFRGKAEETAASAISAYWQLYQVRSERKILEELLNKTNETLARVQGRREIDATDVQIKQTEAYVKTRQAALLVADKNVLDAQDQVVRLMSDSGLNLLDEFYIIPASEPLVVFEKPELSKQLDTAVKNNPVLQQARSQIEIAEINIEVAQNQAKPRLDLTASARTQALESTNWDAQKELPSGDYVSYGLGLSLEYPLGNRAAMAESLKKRIERRKAVAELENLTQKLTVLIREALRNLQADYAQIQIQAQAVEAAQAHLQAVTETEMLREQLTPEFLMVKLQAQETLANTQIAHTKAIADFNIALAELAKTSGTILRMQQVEKSLP